MTDTQRRAAAKQFAADWQGKGYEKGHSQTFWLSLLQKVYGVEEPDKFITFGIRSCWITPALLTASSPPPMS